MITKKQMELFTKLLKFRKNGKDSYSLKFNGEIINISYFPTRPSRWVFQIGTLGPLKDIVKFVDILYYINEYSIEERDKEIKELLPKSIMKMLDDIL
jgi:hypothetical protein